VLRRATGTELDSSGDSLPSIHGTTGTDYNLSSAIPLRSLVFTARRFSNVSDTLPLETRPRRCLDYLPTPAATGGRDESDSRHELHHQSTTTAEAHRCTVSICRASSASPSITSEARPAEDFYLERGMSTTSRRGTDTYKRYKNAVREYRKEKQQQRAALLIEVRAKQKEQPVIDMRE
jgi:hypothetical protein